RTDLLLCSKFSPKPWRLSPESVVDACKESLRRLGLECLHLYQLHYSDVLSQPLKAFGIVNNKDEIYWEGLARCYHEGLVENVGVCNYGPKNVREAHEYLSKKNVPLASNQINFNLMRYRSSLETKEACDELGVRALGYHPLGGGVLTGAYDEEWFGAIPPGINKQSSKARRVRWYQSKCAPVISAVREVADRRGKTAAQVALNWGVCKGVVPISGARSREQVLEAAGGFEDGGGSRWRLTEAEVGMLDEASNASTEYARGFELI
ncbi:hypothetical protein ACHAWF_007570, partial [Thalassiosira exigua]